MATKGSERAAPVTRSLPHVVIGGGGFGGLYAARALAHRPVRVTLLDRRNHHLFQPLLYQVATAALNASDIAVPLRSVLRKATNITVLLAEIERVNLANRRLVLDRGEMGYDALVLAAGASHSYFGHDDWEVLAPGLKSLEDALEIRRRVLLAYEAAERESDGAEQIRARTVLWAAGVAAAPLAQTLGAPLDRSGRVLVEPDLSIPGHPEAFAIGDMCAFLHQTGTPLPGTAPVAIQQGRAVADNVLRRLSGKPTRQFRYRDKGSMATIGRAAAVAVVGRLRLSGLVAWLAWLLVHITFLIGFRNRFLVLFEWAWAYVTWHRGARLITGPWKGSMLRG